MKKLFAILLAGVTLAACGTKTGATVAGTVTGVADGTTIFLHDNAGAKLDSTVVAGGKFGFKIANAHPDQVWLRFDDARIPFFVEPGTITAAIDPAGVTVFSGTPTNDAKNALDESAKPLVEKIKEMRAQIAAAQQGTPEYDALVEQWEAANEASEQHTRQTIMGNPSTVLAAYYLYRSAHSLTTPAEVDSVITIVAGAPANAFTDRLVVRRDALAASSVGVEAPDFTQAQPDGTPLTLSSLRGKLLLIDFWASWCGPCRRENPNVVKVYNAYKDRGFEILGVSLDDNREAWLKAIEDDGLTWKHVSDLGGWSNAVAAQYAVRSIPHTVLVSADGVIIAKNLRGAALEAKVAEVLGATQAQ